MATPDTIAAIATAPGRGAIGIIRVSGPTVPALAEVLLGSLPVPRAATLSRFLDADGSAIDAGVALYFPAPASFTGEAVLELQGHGGAVVLNLVMQRLRALGCRDALPGEFSERAFVNGKLDMTQAEAIADLINAGTDESARAAVRSMRGEFSARIDALQRALTDLRMLVEAAIDFPDEQLDFASEAKLDGRMRGILDDFERITTAARHGTLLRDGLNVVIAGRPNAGKSSLLNRLAGEEIAIVADQPGTTRDVLRQSLQLDGLTVNLIDTAGLRATSDLIEAEGVRRARGEMAKADLLLLVTEATGGADDPAAPLPIDVPVIVVVNKIDLLGLPARLDAGPPTVKIYLSAKTGEGLELLRSHLKQRAGYQGADAGALSARRRHLDALIQARQHVVDGGSNFASTRAVELFAEELRLAQASLSEITGEFGSEQLLGEIFRSFCIGK